MKITASKLKVWLVTAIGQHQYWFGEPPVFDVVEHDDRFTVVSPAFSFINISILKTELGAPEIYPGCTCAILDRLAQRMCASWQRGVNNEFGSFDLKQLADLIKED